ncbi:MAG TPA: AsmA family protein [Bryobacteraceae bacterium]|jgi:uncharacterized protein involved in outer membrane biogenesis
MRTRLAIIAGSLIGLCLLILIALPFFVDVNKYREPVRARLEATLKRPVTIGSLALRRFPFSVEAHDVVIGEDPALGAAAAPFAQTKSLSVKPRWTALIFHWTFEPGSIVLDHPSIELVRKADGSWNFSTIGKSGGGDGSSAMPAIEIRDGTVAFTDLQAQKARAIYNGVDLQLRELSAGTAYQVHASLRDPAASAAAQVDLKSGAIAAKGTLTLKDPKSDASADVAFDFTLDRATELLHIATLQAKLGANSFGATGDADFHQTPAVVHLKADHLKGSIKELAQYAALLGIAFAPSLSVTGDLDGQLAIDGPYNHPTLNGHVEIAKFEATSKTWKQPVKSPQVRLDFTPDSMQAAPMTVTCGNTQLTATGTVTAYATDQPRVDAQIKSNASALDELLNIASAAGLPAAAGVTGQGSASVDIHATGPAKNPNLTGLLSLDNATLNLSSFPKPVSIAHLNMKFAGNSASIDNLALSTGGTNITGNFSVKNFAAPDITFAINADKFDAAQFPPAPPNKKQGPSPFEKLTAKGTLTAGQLISNGITLTQVKTGVSLSHGVAMLSPLTAGMFDGTVSGSIEADLHSSTPTFHTNLTMNQVDANALLSATTPVKQQLFGKLASTSALTFSGTQASLTKSLNGTLNLKLSNGRLMGVNILDEIARAGKFLGFKGDGKTFTTITNLDAVLAIQNGVADASELRLDADGAKVSGTGMINLVDQGLNLRLVATLSKELLDRAGGNTVGGLMVTALSTADGSVVVPIRVTGSFAQPHVTPDAERFAEMRIKMLEHPVDAVKGIFDRLTKRKPDAKEQ